MFSQITNKNNAKYESGMFELTIYFRNGKKINYYTVTVDDLPWIYYPHLRLFKHTAI